MRKINLWALLIPALTLGFGEAAAQEIPKDKMTAHQLMRTIESSLLQKTEPFGEHFSLILTVLNLHKETGWRLKSYGMDEIESGKAYYQGREVEAAIIQWKVKTVNTDLGKSKEECFYTAALNDTKMSTWQNIKTDFCFSIEKQLPKWKEKNRFH